jgi:hypothetical protein
MEKDDIIDVSSIKNNFYKKDTRVNNNDIINLPTSNIPDFNIDRILNENMIKGINMNNVRPELPLHTNNNLSLVPQTKKKKKKKKKNKIKEKKSDDESIDRRRLILILQFYVVEFPEKLKSFKNTKFEKLSEDELINLKNEFDFIIGAKCNVRSTQYAITQGIKLLETVCVNFTPLNVNGLANAVEDDDFRDDCKHLALKYMTLIKTEPEHRIAYKILTSALLLHQINSLKKNNIQQDEASDFFNKNAEEVPSSFNKSEEEQINVDKPKQVEISYEELQKINSKFNDL